VAAARTAYRGTLANGEYEFGPGRFADVATPTLPVSGSESPRYSRDSTSAPDGALPNNRIVVFEGHGPVAMNTAPGLLVDEVLAFVRQPD
jgi:pimeloyl-ACP methyl ester carboxylesterase